MADRDRLDALTGVLIRDLDARRTVMDAAWLEANDVTADRFLASNRATVVTVYLQEKNIVDPARLVSVGYGEWRPVSDNDDAEGDDLQLQLQDRDKTWLNSWREFIKIWNEKLPDIPLYSDEYFDFYNPKVQNWETSGHVPAGQRFMGQMTIPRELSIRHGRLCQNPVQELEACRRNKVAHTNALVTGETALEGIHNGYILVTRLEKAVDDHGYYTGGINYYINYVDLEGNLLWDEGGLFTPDLSLNEGGNFSEGLAMVENRQGLIGYVDASGREVVPCTEPHKDITGARSA